MDWSHGNARYVEEYVTVKNRHLIVAAGFVAYFYDKIRPNTAVELNQCRYNHMGMDVLYRKEPNFRPNLPGVGGCRNGEEECEDCMVTDPKVRILNWLANV